MDVDNTEGFETDAAFIADWTAWATEHNEARGQENRMSSPVSNFLRLDGITLKLGRPGTGEIIVISKGNANDR